MLQRNCIVEQLVVKHLPTTTTFSAGEQSVFLIGLSQFKTQILEKIIVIVSIISACINFHRTSDSSKTDTGRMFICIFTDSVLRIPLGVCINMAKVATGCIGLHSLGQYYIVTRRVNARIDFNCVGIASRGKNLPYCYCMVWLSWPNIFVYSLIAHILRLSLSIRVKFIGTVLIQPLGACIFSSTSAVLRQPVGVWVYISRTILLLPLGVCIEITTGLMSLQYQGPY